VGPTQPWHVVCDSAHLSLLHCPGRSDVRRRCVRELSQRRVCQQLAVEFCLVCIMTGSGHLRSGDVDSGYTVSQRCR